MTLLNGHVQRDATRLAQAFERARPFRHVTIEAFLEPSFAARLLDEFPRFDTRFAINELGQVGGKAVREEVRALPAPYVELDRFIQSREFLETISTVTGIPDLLYDPHYVGGGTHENIDGQQLDPHVDFNYHPGTRWHRRLNLIIYLNPEWDESWGGCLELHSDPWQSASNVTLRVPPLLNRCVIFETTETSWHGFEAIRLPPERRQLSRRSFAIYLYTKERPPEQTAPPHATIYVPGDLRSARAQIRFLYEREKHFNRQIQVLEGALAESRAALRLPLEGFAKQAEAARGYWADAWCAQELAFTVTPTRAATLITLAAWAPPGLTHDQSVEVTAGGRTSSHVLRPGCVDEIAVAIDAAAGAPIEIVVRATETWSPASAGAGDDRALAYRLVGATIE